MQIFVNELMGQVAEEKEKSKNRVVSFEVKHTKARDAYYILSQVVSKGVLIDLIKPLAHVSICSLNMLFFTVLSFFLLYDRCVTMD